MLATSTAFSQDNIKVVQYILLETDPKKQSELETYEVPKDQVWRIESVLGTYDSRDVRLIINDISYAIQDSPRERYSNPQFPFYLPGGTEFKLSSGEGKGTVSICVLMIE